jgi:hypothetical protein
MKALAASVVGLTALLVGGAGVATVAVLATPLLAGALWLLLQPGPAHGRPRG